MRRNECYTEEVWNATSNVCYLLPMFSAYGKVFLSMSIALLMFFSMLRHIPRQHLDSTALDAFITLDHLSIAGVWYALINFAQIEFQMSRSEYFGLVVYAAVSITLYNIVPYFTWAPAVWFYSAPFVLSLFRRDLYTCILRTTPGLHVGLLLTSVVVKMSEEPGVMSDLGFTETGTSCTPMHALFHLCTAVWLTVIINSVKLYRARDRVYPVSSVVQKAATDDSFRWR
ncbi:MAG: hypothetical protein CL484_07455 [Acidobacteria bacterium]|nr:hypothetical protein [Acidobacteriota bacterium]